MQERISKIIEQLGAENVTFHGSIDPSGAEVARRSRLARWHREADKLVLQERRSRAAS